MKCPTFNNIDDDSQDKISHIFGLLYPVLSLSQHNGVLPIHVYITDNATDGCCTSEVKLLPLADDIRRFTPGAICFDIYLKRLQYIYVL